MLKSRCQQGYVPLLRLQRRICFFPFPTSTGYLLFLASIFKLAISGYVLILLSFCLSPLSPSLSPSSTYKDTVITLSLLEKWKIISPSQGLLISKLSSICKHDSPLLYNVTYCQFPWIRLWTSLGGGEVCGESTWGY